MFRTWIMITLIATALLVISHYLWIGRRRSSGGGPVHGRIASVAHLLLVAAIAVLAISSFVPALSGRAMHGWMLLAHTAGGGLFVVTLAALVWILSDRDRPSTTWAGMVRKFCFLLVALLGLCVLISTLLAMTPFFGTQGQRALLKFHAWSGLLMVVATIVHGYLICIGSKRDGTA